MRSTDARVPDWDLEQLEVILEPTDCWQLVVAGPGAGKSAVACQRVAYLVDEGVSASRILVVSFTRTAVAELRDRIVSYAIAGEAARRVRISTIDSHAWSLRAGFDDEPLSKSLAEGIYDLSIERTIELFRRQKGDLIDFIARLEHLIIDEAQDVMGVRAELAIEMLNALSPTCGVTILADPAQAIHGFTTDGGGDDKPQQSLLERLPSECTRPFLQRTLKNLHRVKDGALIDLFLRTRREIEFAENADGHIARVQQVIRETCAHDIDARSFESLAEFLNHSRDGSTLVLFRWRADVLVASSYCSHAEVEHRLRMSDLPVVLRPWLGWLLGESEQAILTRDEFDKLWEQRAATCSAPFVGEEREACWTMLHRLAAGTRARTLDLVHLCNIVARARPPMELCYPELGTAGPILGTIHASKGREADTVVLVMPPNAGRKRDAGMRTESASIFEEGRVYYVGATRARKMLAIAASSATRVGYLESGRIYRGYAAKKAQLEVGREGDVDKVAHLSWSSSVRVQHTLAAHAGRTVSVRARAVAEDDYALRVVLQHKDADGVTRETEIGQLSSSFRADLGRLWSRIDSQGSLRPAEGIPHLYLAAVGTVGLSEHERGAVKRPFSQSGLALAPVVKGFPMISFLYRRKGRFAR